MNINNFIENVSVKSPIELKELKDTAFNIAGPANHKTTVELNSGTSMPEIRRRLWNDFYVNYVLQ